MEQQKHPITDNLMINQIQCFFFARLRVSKINI